ncbi:MAG: hypothetical protein ACI8RZ_000806 [Myxococcota bacterium]
MSPDVFSEALLATARVACCVSLLGCGPKVAPITTVAPAPTEVEQPSELDWEAMAPLSEAESSACREQVTEYFAANPIDHSMGMGAEIGALIGADNLACCHGLINGTDIGGDARIQECCDATGRYDGMCYPWGPPRPPSMAEDAETSRDRALLVRAAARGEGGGASLDLRHAARAAAPSLQASGGLREIAVTTWTGRMINEHESHHVFLALAARLAAVGVDPEEVARCLAFADEERTHGVLCGAVVEALGGTALASVPDAGAMPEHAGVEPLEALLRDLLSICCLSETVAVALIGAERLELPEGALRELLTQIYADECGHANFGWRLLPELLPDDEAMKARLSDYLAHALLHLEAHELTHIPARPAPVGGAALGLCSGLDGRRLLTATIEQVILPGLAAHGLDATAAWAARA